MSCAFTFWHIVGYGHTDDPMSILHLAVNLVGGELCIWHLDVCNNANNSMSIAYPALANIVGKLCILAYWLWWLCLWYYICFSFFSGNHRRQVVPFNIFGDHDCADHSTMSIPHSPWTFIVSKSYILPWSLLKWYNCSCIHCPFIYIDSMSVI